MSRESDLTLQTYNECVDEYIAGTPQVVSGEIKDWIDRSLAKIPAGGTVLEIGSAFGRDADYIESQGFRVERTDATLKFVELLQRRGHSARLLNVITDNLGGPYDMVFADAVFLHFTPDEAAHATVNVRENLRPGGIFAATLKQGDGAEWSEEKLGAPRYFTYWRPPGVQRLLSEAGFEVVSLVPEDEPEAKWLHVIAKRQVNLNLETYHPKHSSW